MEIKKIIVDNEEIEYALNIDKEYFEKNTDLQDTLDLSLNLKDLQQEETDEQNK